jgi:L-ascorbate metabolism protein UlaG (beta-lactamase superfamily)
MSSPVITLAGGPTALIEAGGSRLLTDPSFDHSGKTFTEGWAHFTQNAEDLAKSFTALGIGPQLKIIERGVPTRIDPR